MTKQVGSTDLIILCGDPLDKQWTWKSAGVAVDLTGYTARAQVRASFTSAEKLLDLTTANSKIVLGGAAGTITLALTEAETEALWTNHSTGLKQAGVYADRAAYMLGYWDLEMINGSAVPKRKMQGRCLLVPGVTKP